MDYHAQQIAMPSEMQNAVSDLAIEQAQSRPIAFDEFLVLPESRTLLCKGAPVQLGGRAFDLLMVLLQSRGTVVTREAIVRYVWPSTIVEESNLRFQVACLRKALGAARDCIKSVQGRGYLLVGAADSSAVRSISWTDRVQLAHARDGRPAIFVVDKDDVIRQALDRLLRSFDADVVSFASFDALLESSAALRHAQ